MELNTKKQNKLPSAIDKDLILITADTGFEKIKELKLNLIVPDV